MVINISFRLGALANDIETGELGQYLSVSTSVLYSVLPKMEITLSIH